MAMRLATFLWTVLIFQNVNAAVPHTFMAGDPARASEVNANFTSLDTAIQANATAIEETSEINQFFDRSRVYPNWRYDPEFFIASPTLGGNWQVRLNDAFSRTSLSNVDAAINLTSGYIGGTSDPHLAWFGIYVDWRPDTSAASAAFRAQGATELYVFELRHSRGLLAPREFTNVTYSQDPIAEYQFSVAGQSVELPWRYYATTEIVAEAIRAISVELGFARNTTDACTQINLHLNADMSVSVNATCVTYQQP